MARQPSERARLEVLLEDIQTRVRVVAEGHSTLSRQMEEILAELKGVRAELGQRIGFVEAAVSELSARFGEHLSAHTA